MTKKKERQITIRMPKAKLEKWLATLRLPANQKLQGSGMLFNGEVKSEGGGYCCLGALQCAVTGGKVEIEESYPSRQWLSKEGIMFWDQDGGRTNNPYFPRFETDAAEANDGLHKSFKQIAQAIESCAVGY